MFMVAIFVGGFGGKGGAKNVIVTMALKSQLRLLPWAGREMSTGQEAVAIALGWEGNRGFSVAPTTHHRLCGI